MSAPDPMKGFRGVMAAVLILEVIVVLLALLVVAKTDDGMQSWQAWVVSCLAAALILACGIVGRPWAIWVCIGLQLAMVACFFVLPALGGVGLLFGLAWSWMLWARNDVAKRMAEGRLTSQTAEVQPPQL